MFVLPVHTGTAPDGATQVADSTGAIIGYALPADIASAAMASADPAIFAAELASDAGSPIASDSGNRLLAY